MPGKRTESYDHMFAQISGWGQQRVHPPQAGQFSMSRQQAMETIKGVIDAIRVPMRLEVSVWSDVVTDSSDKGSSRFPQRWCQSSPWLNHLQVDNRKCSCFYHCTIITFKFLMTPLLDWKVPIFPDPLKHTAVKNWAQWLLHTNV